MALDAEVLREIFFPEGQLKVLRAQKLGTRFVHYTSAAVAASILKNAEFWMRRTSTMGDFAEVNHGLDALRYCVGGEVGNRLRQAINEVHPSVFDEMLARFDGWSPEFVSNTFVACFSEHDGSEDQLGRLSMWRAYGGDSGVALVLRPEVFFSDSSALKIFSSPVHYMDQTAVDGALRVAAFNIKQRREDLKQVDRDDIAAYVFAMLRMTALCTKHPGFKEEREWRAIYNPTLESSPRVRIDVEVVRGVPQPIAKVPLADIPDEGMTGLAIPSFVERVIIGPTEYAGAMRDAFISLLEEAGVERAGNRVFVSNIPLRTRF